MNALKEAVKQYFSNKTKEELLDMVAEYIPDYAQRAKECGNGTRHRSHIGRVISDYNINCLYSLYFRFECIDEQGREYQQPYFANGHQNEATREVSNE